MTRDAPSASFPGYFQRCRPSSAGLYGCGTMRGSMSCPGRRRGSRFDMWCKSNTQADVFDLQLARQCLQSAVNDLRGFRPLQQLSASLVLAALSPSPQRSGTILPSPPGAARTGRSVDTPLPPDPNSHAPGRARRPRGARRSTPPPSPGTTNGTRAARPRSRTPGEAWKSCCR